MNISKRKQGILAIICTIAMIVTSITVYNPREVKAAASGSGNGMKYTVSGESQEGGLIGFACSEVKIFNAMDGYMHFAWSGADEYRVDTGTIKAQIDGRDVATYGSAPTDTFIGYSQFKDLEVGEHQIKISGTTSASSKEIYATATLKIEKVEGTTELQKPSAPGGLEAHIDGLKTNYTIAFGNVATATSYKFYLDGKYKKDITNGGTVNIEELGLEAGKTYKFGVSAVNAAGESGITTIDVKVPGKEEETTTGSSTEPFDPSTIKDSEWTLALNSKTVSYYIADNKSDKVNVKPQLEGDNYYVAFTIPAVFKSVTFDGVSKDVTDGGYYRVKVSDLTSGYHTLVVTDHYGNESVTIYFKVAKEEGTTTPTPETDERTGKIVQGKIWKAYTSAEDNKGHYEISSDATNYTLKDKNIGSAWWHIQTAIDGVTFYANTEYVCTFTLKADKPKEFTVDNRIGDGKIFVESEGKGWQKAEDGTYFYKYKGTFASTAKQDLNVRIALGYHNDKDKKTDANYSANEIATFGVSNFQIVKASEYKAVTYTVSIDGTEKTYEEGDSISVPADGQGYYDVTKKVAYAPGTVLAVNENMTLKSIELNVAMTPGASIRLAAPTGLRFQTTVTSGNDIDEEDILNLTTGTVTTGTLITTKDLYEANGNTLTKDSTYNFLDIVNDGWFNDGTKTTTGKFCGSIVRIEAENYGRAYIAVGYATINYSNGEPKTVYADVTVNNAKSIKGVAEKIQGSAAYNKYTPAQQGIINNYIKGEEISK